MLGSPRVITDSEGNVMARRDFKPFGEEITNNTGERNIVAKYGVSDNLRQKFTTYQRDDESGLDFAEARMYENRHGRFTAVDPYNIIFEAVLAETKKEGDVNRLSADYLSKPKNWNRYVYVWNSPLRLVDPNGEREWVIMYTNGNSDGDNEFRRAAETVKKEIEGSDSFDPKKDIVLLISVGTKEDVQNSFDFAASFEKATPDHPAYGKIIQFQMFSHAGQQGPVLHPPGTANAAGVQWTNVELKSLRINWDRDAEAYFNGCYTANFAQTFADAQNVVSYGNNRYAYFSSNPNTRVGPLEDGPLYLFESDGRANGSYWTYLWGNSKKYPMVKKSPRKAK